MALDTELERSIDHEYETIFHPSTEVAQGEFESAEGHPEWEIVTAAPEYTVFPTDDRVRVTNTSVEPFRHICKLEMVFVDPKTGRAGNYIATGTLVSPRKVLTAGHCVYDRGFGAFARSIRVIPGKNGPGRSRPEEPFGFAMASRLDVPPEYRTAPNHAAAMPFDYGVITLKTPIGARAGWWKRIGYKPDAFLRAHKINTSGYPGDKGGNHQYRVYDRVVTVFPQRLEYVHDIMGGQSGSPMWVRWQNYRIITAIVTTHDDPATAVRANTGVRITPVSLANIRRWLTS